MSCNPASLVRDLDQLGGRGFRLTRLEAHDMLPGTAHVELLARIDP